MIYKRYYRVAKNADYERYGFEDELLPHVANDTDYDLYDDIRENGLDNLYASENIVGMSVYYAKKDIIVVDIVDANGNTHTYAQYMEVPRLREIIDGGTHFRSNEDWEKLEEI